MTKKKQYCPKSKKLMCELGDLNGSKFAQKNTLCGLCCAEGGFILD